jgi:hypothetical protein
LTAPLAPSRLDGGAAAVDNGSPREILSGAMWISKPIYESLPYFYLLVGVISLSASMYVNHWYWPTICFVTGVVCLVGGLVVLLKRRDSRITQRRGG